MVAATGTLSSFSVLMRLVGHPACKSAVTTATSAAAAADDDDDLDDV